MLIKLAGPLLPRPDSGSPMRAHAMGHKDILGPRESVGEANASVLLEIQLEVCLAGEKSVVTVWVGQHARPRGPELFGGGTANFTGGHCQLLA